LLGGQILPEKEGLYAFIDTASKGSRFQEGSGIVASLERRCSLDGISPVRVFAVFADSHAVIS